MAGKSKLSEVQWSAIKDRVAQGESVASLSKEFKISRAAIANRVSQSVQAIKSAANQIVRADEALKALPITDRVSACNLAEKLKSISGHLASAAESGARTASRLAAMAHTQVDALDEYDPLSKPETLKGIAVLSQMANEASQTGINLLRANKETVDTLNVIEETPPTLTELYQRMGALKKNGRSPL